MWIFWGFVSFEQRCGLAVPQLPELRLATRSYSCWQTWTWLMCKSSMSVPSKLPFLFYTWRKNIQTIGKQWGFCPLLFPVCTRIITVQLKKTKYTICIYHICLQSAYFYLPTSTDLQIWIMQVVYKICIEYRILCILPCIFSGIISSDFNSKIR